MQDGVMMQFFHWYTEGNGKFWKHLKEEASTLADKGITALWLPPAFKASAGSNSVGYDIYDLFDLGEFDQKSSLKTKYGTKDEYIEAIAAIRCAGVQVYADIVINHLAGADEKELVRAIKVNPENRTEIISEPYDIEAYTKFTYPGRKKKYSNFEWNHTCFSGTDYDDLKRESAIFSIINDAGADWEEMVDDEKGNYDYLMYADIEFRNPVVREHLKSWGKWYYNTVNFDGVRLDAVKHISPGFYNEWLDYMRNETGKDFFAVGEYWAPGNLASLQKYIEATDKRMSLFDSSLHNNFHKASTEGKNYNLSTIFDNTLLTTMPELAVTVVDNHDTQPLQALEAPVAPWFKPLAYSLILLRPAGYPCIFYPDMYGAKYTDKGRDGNDYTIELPIVTELEKLLWLRRYKALGLQRDYFDHANCIGWTREGEHPDAGCAIIMSNGEKGFKQMEIGKVHAGKAFIDSLQHVEGIVTIDQEGRGDFYCEAGAVSVWIAA